MFFSVDIRLLLRLILMSVWAMVRLAMMRKDLFSKALRHLYTEISNFLDLMFWFFQSCLDFFLCEFPCNLLLMALLLHGKAFLLFHPLFLTVSLFTGYSFHASLLLTEPPVKLRRLLFSWSLHALQVRVRVKVWFVFLSERVVKFFSFLLLMFWFGTVIAFIVRRLLLLNLLLQLYVLRHQHFVCKTHRLHFPLESQDFLLLVLGHLFQVVITCVPVYVRSW